MWGTGTELTVAGHMTAKIQGESKVTGINYFLKEIYHTIWYFYRNYLEHMCLVRSSLQWNVWQYCLNIHTLFVLLILVLICVKLKRRLCPVSPYGRFCLKKLHFYSIRLLSQDNVHKYHHHHHRSVVCLMTVPWPLPKPVLHRVRSSASPFNFQYPLFPLRPSSSCLRLLPLLHTSSIVPLNGL